MGEKGSKKDKNKAGKQKKDQLEKKKEQHDSKLPTKKPAWFDISNAWQVRKPIIVENTRMQLCDLLPGFA